MSHASDPVARHFASSTDTGSSELTQIAKAVEAIGLDASDLAQLIGDDGADELPSVPPDSNGDALVYADGRVFRSDGRRIGRVRLVGGAFEDVHELRLDSEASTTYHRLFGGMRVYLLSQSASSGRRVAIGCAETTFLRSLSCSKPVGPVRHTTRGSEHPCDDNVREACAFLFKKSW